MSKPLTGLRVWITRPAHSAAGSVATWRDAGADAVAVPLVHLAAHPLSAETLALLDELPRPWTVVLTSQNAARFLVEALAPHARLRGALDQASAFAVGAATAATARELGLSVVETPSRATGADLARLLIARLAPGRGVVLPGSDQQRPEVRDTLAQSGIDVTSVIAYHTLPVTSIDRTLAAELSSGHGPLILLYSPSAVHALMDVLTAENVAPARTRVAAVGPTTERAAFDAGLQVVAVPEQPGEAALVDGVVAWWSGRTL